MAGKDHLDRQADFSGGEIAPQSYGKMDAPAYQHGLRTALNMIPTLDGPIVNRPGTRYVAAVKTAGQAPRLVSFIFSDQQTFVLEIGDKYMRFVHNGAQVLNGGNPYEIVTPWAIADVLRLTWSQSGDVISFDGIYADNSASYAPYELTRVSNTNWTLTAVSYSGQAYFAGDPYIGYTDRGTNPALPIVAHGAVMSGFADYDNTKIYRQGDWVRVVSANPAADGNTRIYVSLTNQVGRSPGAFPNFWGQGSFGSSPSYKKGDYTWDSALAGRQIYMCLLDESKGGGDPNTAPGNWQAATDLARVPREWQWILTQIYFDSNGVTHETLGSTPTTLMKVALQTDRPGLIQWGAETAQAFKFQIIGYRIYRGHDGVFGLVGTTLAGVYQFRDDGASPDFGTQPPRGTNPFMVATSAAPGGGQFPAWPGVVTYHEQRLLHARSNRKPQDIWGSAIGDYKRFDVNTPVQDSDAINFRPASEQLEEVRWLLSLRHLLIGTGQGVWNCYGATGPLKPSNIVLRRASRKGCSYLRPLAADSVGLYYTSKGWVRDLIFDYRTDNYGGRNVSLIARHMFRRRTIVDWAYAEEPFSLVYAVRDDGTLLTMTYDPGVEAWARHTTAGAFERVASVTETDPVTGAVEDAVYVVVKRIINNATVRYIERFASREIGQKSVANADGTTTYTDDVRRCNFLDAALEYDGRNLVQNITITDSSGGLFAGGTQVAVAAAANPIVVAGGANRGFAAGDIGSSIVIDSEGAAGGPIEARIIAFTNGTHVTCELQANLPAAFQGVQLTASLAITTVTGLTHLNGQNVNVLADGAVAGPFPVAGGSITLGGPAVIVQVGIGYNADLELLDLAAEGVKTNVMSVRKATFEVVSSRGLLVGETFDIPPASTGRTTARLVAPQLQKVSDGNVVPPLFTGQASVPIWGDWGVGARMCLRQSDPLPLTVIAAIRDVTIGGR